MVIELCSLRSRSPASLWSAFSFLSLFIPLNPPIAATTTVFIVLDQELFQVFGAGRIITEIYRNLNCGLRRLEIIQ